MKSEVVLKKRYTGYDLIVRKVSYEPREIPASLYPINDHWYCGYVVIPKGSPFYGMDYEDLEDDIWVHGGLTFSGEIEGVDGYLLGFDCNHDGDNPLVQDEEYTFKECKSLADQIISLEELIKSGNKEDKTYRYEVHCEIDVKASTGVEARKKLEEEYGSFFHTFIGIVNEDGEVEDERDFNMIKASVEFAETPPDKREEEKKFYLRHKWLNLDTDNYLHLDVDDGSCMLDDNEEFSFTKIKLTEKEIEEIKEKFDTDLADFELVEVEDD